MGPNFGRPATGAESQKATAEVPMPPVPPLPLEIIE